MKKRIDSLQVLRAFAFWGIFSTHSGISLFRAGGQWGVSVFFVLSGFLMFLSYSNTDRIKEHGFIYSIKFGIGKIAKLYPLHIVTMLIAIPPMIVYLEGSLFNKLFDSSAQVILNVTLTKSWIPNSNFYSSLNSVSWYLSTSLFLYIMFPFILSKMKKYKKPQTAVIAMSCIYLLQIIAFLTVYIINEECLQYTDLVHWFTYIFPITRLGDFFIGCNLGYIFQNSKKAGESDTKKYTMSEIIVVIVIILQWIVYSMIFPIQGDDPSKTITESWWDLSIFWTVSSCALIYIFAKNSGKLSKLLSCKPVLFIAEMSANAFLIHKMVFRYLYSIEMKIFGEEYRILNYFICFFITIICSYLWEIIIRSFCKRKSSKKENP